MRESFSFLSLVAVAAFTFLYNESIKTQGRGNYDKAAGFQYVVSEFYFVLPG